MEDRIEVGRRVVERVVNGEVVERSDTPILEGGRVIEVNVEQHDTDPEAIHPPTLEAQAPMLVTQVLSELLTFIITYGWVCLGLGLLCWLLWRNFKQTFYDWCRRREEHKEAALYHKNPDLLLAKEAALDDARSKMQERYATASQQHAEKQRLKQAEKERLRLEAFQKANAGGRTLGESSSSASAADNPEKKKPTYRPEYNPLTGSGGDTCGYRPGRRGRAAGGG